MEAVTSATLETFLRCWVKAAFGEALGDEVEVELVQAIGRGDECCEFLVLPLHLGGLNGGTRL